MWLDNARQGGFCAREVRLMYTRGMCIEAAGR